MIHLRKVKDNKYEIFLDGSICRNAYAYSRKTEIGEFEIISKNKFDSKNIAQHSLSEIPSFIHLSLSDLFDWLNFKHSLSLTVGTEKGELGEYLETGYLDVCFQFYPDLTEWKENYTFTQYTNTFKEIWDYKNILSSEFKIYGDDSPSIYLIFETQPNFNLSITEFVSEFEDTVKEIQSEVIKKLDNSLNSVSILEVFDFPEELKIPCEQYLLYFAQFLRDLGINATSSLKEEAGKVLFSITPNDDIKALDKIHHALAIYLSLYSNPISQSTGDRTVDMVLSGARANAKHLESQLELAFAKLQFTEATLELKDATIEQNQLAFRQKDKTIEDLKEMLAKGNIFEESLEKIVINGEVVEETSLYRFSREDDIEVEATPILDENNEETRIGLVKFHEVIKLKDYGVSLDLPKAIRDLIDYFKRDKH